MESGVQLARRLRDLADLSLAFGTTNVCVVVGWRKLRHGGAKINYAKAPGPVARLLIPIMMPIVLKAMNVEKSMGTEQRHTIDWDEPILPAAR